MEEKQDLASKSLRHSVKSGINAEVAKSIQLSKQSENKLDHFQFTTFSCSFYTAFKVRQAL